MIRYVLLATLLLSSTTSFALTDKDCKAFILFKEANLEPMRAKKAVLDVVNTRMKVKKKSACQIMKEKHQFSFYRPKMKIVVDKEMLEVYDKVNRMQPVFKEAQFFHHVKVKPKWNYRKLKYLGTVGSHRFYKLKEK